MGDFADLVRRWRDRRLLSQEALAAAAEMSVRAVRNVELGTVSRPRAATVRLLARALRLEGPDLEEFESAARGETVAGRISGSETTPAPARPAQLPLDTAGFVGRRAELDALDRLLVPGSAVPAAVITAVSGTAGIGKTTLALHWAHAAASRFPAGQLYLDLHGYDDERDPVSPAEALASLLRSLGVDDPDVPLELDDRAAAFRTAVADAELLLVLDNARTVDQVRPLLPGSRRCRVLVTSRDSLAGLVAREGATRLVLDLLSEADSVALLEEALRPAAEDRAALPVLAELCARLPLALRVAAERAGAVPGLGLGELVQELSEEHARLNVLSGVSDPHSSLRAVFSWSYRHLSSVAARVFRSIGLLPAFDLSAEALAAAVALPIDDTARALATLTDAHLVRPIPGRRFRMHDLLRAYGAELARETDSDDARGRTIDQLLRHYTDETRRAVSTLYPSDVPPTSTAPVLSADQATAWLARERDAINTLTTLAADRSPATAVELVQLMWPHLYATGGFADAAMLLDHALRAARTVRDTAAEASARRNLATVLWTAGRGEDALGELRESLILLRRLDDPTGTAKTLNNLGLVQWWLGNNEQAVEALEEALEVHRQLGNVLDQVKALSNLGLAAWRAGRYQDALRLHGEALTLCEQIGDRIHEAAALNNVGVIHQRLGRLDQAQACHERALWLARSSGAKPDEVEALGDLGLVAERAGRAREAIALHEQALAIAEEYDDHGAQAEAMHNLGVARLSLGDHEAARGLQSRALTVARSAGDRGREVSSLNGLGEASVAAGDSEAGHAALTEALAVAEGLGDPFEQARAHAGLARVAAATGRPDDVERHANWAATAYEELGVPVTRIVDANR